MRTSTFSVNTTGTIYPIDAHLTPGAVLVSGDANFTVQTTAKNPFGDTNFYGGGGGGISLTDPTWSTASAAATSFNAAPSGSSALLIKASTGTVNVSVTQAGGIA